MSTRPFRFRLETVQRLREETEKGRQRDLATALSEADLREAEREHLNQLEEATRAERDAHAGDVGRQQSLDRLVQQVRRHRARAEEACAQAAERVARCQDSLAQAVTERRALDRLRDRRYRDWKTQADRAEQKALDEVSVVVGHAAASSHDEPNPGEGS